MIRILRRQSRSVPAARGNPSRNLRTRSTAYQDRQEPLPLGYRTLLPEPQRNARIRFWQKTLAERPHSATAGLARCWNDSEIRDQRLAELEPHFYSAAIRRELVLQSEAKVPVYRGVSMPQYLEILWQSRLVYLLYQSGFPSDQVRSEDYCYLNQPPEIDFDEFDYWAANDLRPHLLWGNLGLLGDGSRHPGSDARDRTAMTYFEENRNFFRTDNGHRFEIPLAHSGDPGDQGDSLAYHSSLFVRIATEMIGRWCRLSLAVELEPELKQLARLYQLSLSHDKGALLVLGLSQSFAQKKAYASDMSMRRQVNINEQKRYLDSYQFHRELTNRQNNFAPFESSEIAIELDEAIAEPGVVDATAFICADSMRWQQFEDAFVAFFTRHHSKLLATKRLAIFASNHPLYSKI